MKINSKIHGIIDYLVVVFLLLSPSIFEMPKTTTMFTYMLGVVHLTLSICTNYEMGLAKFLPFKFHGIIELVVALVLVGLAFYLENLDGEFSKNYYLGFAFAVFVVWLLTDYTNKPMSNEDLDYVESNTDSPMI